MGLDWLAELRNHVDRVTPLRHYEAFIQVDHHLHKMDEFQEQKLWTKRAYLGG